MSIMRALLAEALGTAGLLAVVVGSGIMAERLFGGNVGLALLANSLATGAGLIALIWTFAGVSGAHFNPVVSLAAAARGTLPWRRVPTLILVQILAAVAGVMLAHAMFDVPLVQLTGKVRTGPAQWLSEVVATCGLLLVIMGSSRHRPEATPYAVAGYVTAGYWFTASTCFANPAVTIARGCTGTFAGIAMGDVPAFIAAQLVGLAVAVGLGRILFPKESPS